MRFREVGRHLEHIETRVEEKEKLTYTQQNSDNFKKIKPQTDITIEEAQQFWNDYFEKLFEDDYKLDQE